jgi:excisionase family DNA binding protein
MRRINCRRISDHLNYTVREAATRLGVSWRTIHRWINRGLPTVDRRRPLLIVGRDLKHFLEQRSKAPRRQCPQGHLFCVRCREPKVPAGNMVDGLPTGPLSGLLRGICPTCGTLVHRATNTAGLEVVTRELEVALPRAERRLNRYGPALVDVHFNGVDHAKA